MGMGGGFERPVEETVINNYYDEPRGASARTTVCRGSNTIAPKANTTTKARSSAMRATTLSGDDQRGFDDSSNDDESGLDDIIRFR